MKKCKISFRYESEEEYSEEDFKMIKDNIKNLCPNEESIKDMIDSYVLDAEHGISRILDYKLEFTEWDIATKIFSQQMKKTKTTQ